MEAALEVADAQRHDGVLTTLDLLGEDVTTDAQVRANVEIYEALVDTFASDARFADKKTRPSISLKPSAFTTGHRDLVRAPITALAERAHERGVALTIDMEDHHWTDLTIGLSVSLFERGFDVGTVLQTRLHRTAHDLQAIPAGMRLRLVIGIYREPADVAATDKRVMKERMVDYAATLLDLGAFVEFASHDLHYAHRFLRDVAPKAPDRCEMQMLLGVPRAEFRRKLRQGELGPAVPMRLYVPFADGWDNAMAYLRRRMEESPSVGWLVLRNLFAGRER